MQLRVSCNDEGYGSLIKNFFEVEFPSPPIINETTLLDNLTNIILSSSQIRYGPKPSPEGIVFIRGILRKYIQDEAPIPFISPFGSRKGKLGEPMDMAEVYALRQLDCLHKRVSKIYSPGINIRIRLEDASGPYLFTDEGEESISLEKIYCNNMVKLSNLMGYSGHIHPILESTMFSQEKLFSLSNYFLPVIQEYLEITEKEEIALNPSIPSWKKLNDLGWYNPVSLETRTYYKNRYKVFYPNLSDREAIVKLSRYFSQAWARNKLGDVADPSWGNDYLKISFVGPVPGQKPGLRDIYYRTLPLRFTEYHIMPWRAKGYLQIAEDGTITPKIAHWGKEQTYFENNLHLSNSSEELTIRADYTLV